MKFLRGAFWIFFMGALVAGAGCGMGSGSGRSDFVGRKIQERQKFSLKDLNGQTVSLDALLQNHKAVLINFWATWCPYCVEEMPELIKLETKQKNRSFEVVGIDVGESQQRAAPFAKKIGVNYTCLLDDDGDVAEKFRVVGIPTSYLIASDGTVLGEYHSFSTELEADVEKALKE